MDINCDLSIIGRRVYYVDKDGNIINGILASYKVSNGKIIAEITRSDCILKTIDIDDVFLNLDTAVVVAKRTLDIVG